MTDAHVTKIDLATLARALNVPHTTGRLKPLDLAQVLDIQDSVTIHNESVTDIARRMRMSTKQVYLIAEKADIPIRRGHLKTRAVSLRSIVEEMKPADALEYVLQAYENLVGHFDNESHIVFDELKLTAAESIIFNILYHRKGFAISKSVLLDCYCATLNEDSMPHSRTAEVLVCRIKKKVAGTRFSIETIRGFGYRLDEQSET